jgi:hypothetical protein
MVGFVLSLFSVLAVGGVPGAHGSRQGQINQSATRAPQAAHLSIKSSKQFLHLARERHILAVPQGSEHIPSQVAKKSDHSKMLLKTTPRKMFQHKSKHAKLYRPNNRTAELAANRERLFYKSMSAVKNALGFIGKTTFGKAFHLGRHLGRHSRDECGTKWEEGCVEAVACYASTEENGCCWAWHGHMDTTGACAPCAEAMGYCDPCYQDSFCAHHDDAGNATGHDGEWESVDHGDDHGDWEDTGDWDHGDWDNASWSHGANDWEGEWEEHPKDWNVQEMDNDEMRKVFEEAGLNPAAIENTCGDKWDTACAQAWACYDVVEEYGCCDTASSPPQIFTENECAACAQVAGICDDCFPMSPCGDERLEDWTPAGETSTSSTSNKKNFWWHF